MNAVSPDKQVGLDRGAAAEVRHDPVTAILVAFEPVPEQDGVRRAGGQFLAQAFDQVGAVDMDVFCAPPMDGVLAQRDVEDLRPAPAPAHFGGLRAESVAHDAGADAEGVEHLHCIGAELQAGPDLADDP